MSAPINDGGPAFPFGQISEFTGQPINGCFAPGMTLRDFLAASYRVKRVGDDALPLGYSIEPICEMFGIKPPEPKSPTDYLRADLEVEAHIKYMHADAMLAARDKKETQP